MSDDDLVDRIAQQLAAGQPVDWTAAMASATPAQRKQLEALRLLYRIAQEPAGAATSRTTDGRGPVAPVTELGSDWGRYTLVEEAGSGSYGTVYRAFDSTLDLDVAIKVLHRQVSDDLLRERLIKEGRALAKVRHHNVVRVLGVEFNGDRIGLCTEFVHGETLEQEVLTRGTFSEAEAIEVGKAVCQALAAVHRTGVLHRDVKARNVMRERDTGRIVLMDFGTGRELTDEVTAHNFIIEGTSIYMAPETLSGQSASQASDVYSVGVLLYYLLTATYPVEGRSIPELRLAHARGQRTPLGNRRPDLSPGFIRVVERAMATRANRYATAPALCDELEALATADPLWLRRLKTGATIAAATLGGIVALGFINTFYVNIALGRSGFVNEGIEDWFTWGLRSTLAPVVVSAMTVLATTLIIEFLRLLVQVSPAARRAERWATSRIHRHSLDDVGMLSSVSLLASAAVLFVAWWYFAPLLGTLTTNVFPDIASVPLQQLKWLSPEYGQYHLAYREVFLGTTIACVMLWYPTVRLAVRKRQRIPRRTAIGGAIVLTFAFLFLDFPYRLLSHDIDFDEVTWDERACHVLGARGDDRLIFCASLPTPRNRIVRADALVPHPVVTDPETEGPGTVAAKRKRSIFKFLLNVPEAGSVAKPGS